MQRERRGKKGPCWKSWYCKVGRGLLATWQQTFTGSTILEIVQGQHCAVSSNMGEAIAPPPRCHPRSGEGCTLRMNTELSSIREISLMGTKPLYIPGLCQIRICLSTYSEAPVQGLLRHQSPGTASAPGWAHGEGPLREILEKVKHKKSVLVGPGTVQLIRLHKAQPAKTKKGALLLSGVKRTLLYRQITPFGLHLIVNCNAMLSKSHEINSRGLFPHSKSSRCPLYDDYLTLNHHHHQLNYLFTALIPALPQWHTQRALQLLLLQLQLAASGFSFCKLRQTQDNTPWTILKRNMVKLSALYKFRKELPAILWLPIIPTFNPFCSFTKTCKHCANFP